jgi:sec-independent protein translocase protein TatC
MTLGEHFREFRRRLFIAAASILVASIVAGLFYDQVFDFLTKPFYEYAASNPQVEASINFAEATSALSNLISLSIFVGVVVSSPIWLYQIWAFIVPGLHNRERKWTRVFAAIAGPLFLCGVVVGYVTLPKGLAILIQFTQKDLVNLVEFGDYLTFLIRTLLVFGIAFEIPVFVILLNLAGVLKGRALSEHRPWIVIGTFVFAAVATPSTDPFTMLILAIPMLILFVISEVICRILDRRRHEREQQAGVGDDELSPL